MKKYTLLKILSLFFYLLSGTFSMSQEVASSTCNDPAGGCDTIGIERKISPWRVGGFLGPAVAFCGSWDATFNTNKVRDKALFNGIGFNAALNADYFFKNKKKENRFQIGVGAVAGLQNFFFRKDIDTFIDQVVANSGSKDAVVRKGSSEDHYFVVGPVMNFAFGKKPRSPFLEASVRGGVFRSTPAAIFVYDRITGNNIYSVTASDKRYHAGVLATLGFFVPSKNGLWAWGVEAMGFRTKLDYIFPGATIFPYDRKHGGFSAGLAMRRKFIYDVAVKKEPTAGIICIAPELELKMGSESMKGMMYSTGKETSMADPIKLTWKSRSTPDTTKTETFTARIHRLDQGSDIVIASVVCQEGNELAFPTKYLDTLGRPVAGQYYVTVQSQRLSDCASCTSEASTTGFAVKDSIIPPCVCNKLYSMDLYGFKNGSKSVMMYTKSLSPDCQNCICPATPKTVPTRRKVVIGNINGKVGCDTPEFNLNEEIARAKIIIPKGISRVFISVETIEVNTCKELDSRSTTLYSAEIVKGSIGTFFEVDEKAPVSTKMKKKKK